MVKFNLVDSIIDFESGQLNNQGVLNLFSHLIKTGKINSLQGFYGRTASVLIEGGYLDVNGKILKDLDEV